VETSCFRAADAAALGVVRSMHFDPFPGPARRTLATVKYGVNAATIRLLGDADVPVRTNADDKASAKNSSSKAKVPRLRNRRDVQASITRHYPRAERAAGVGGAARVWMNLDKKGHVVFSQIIHSSDNCAIDQAALAVSPDMDFSPARDRDGDATPVWVSMNVVFKPR
jgi:TonB family protein